MNIIKISVKMDSIIADSQGYIYAISDEEMHNIKYTKIDISDSEINQLKNNNIIHKKAKDGKEGEIWYIPLFGNGSFNGVIILLDNKEMMPYPGLYLVVWIFIIGAIVISNIISFYLYKKLLVRPLLEINEAAKKFAKGEVDKRIDIESNDEIGELADSFNVMAESLEKVEALRMEFISNVSHELRSPITSIKGFITGILDGVVPKDKEKHYLNIINNEVNRLSRLVTDLLDISSMESGAFKLNIEKVDINEIITLCILNLEAKIKENMMSVNVIFNHNSEYCFADRDRIIQVIINIIDNAIKYGNNGGEIIIETYSKGDLVYTSIFNTGSNIAKEDINKVWTRFYKADKSRTSKNSMGLGLSIVRTILTYHKQDIWFENIDGKGVKFIFTLKKVGK
ncbi:MAG: HAMP domain-containing histidine kinase [Clostridium sp.]|nr:HAMP domain-containing histidine kinase [Clostridium sp.]